MFQRRPPTKTKPRTSSNLSYNAENNINASAAAFCAPSPLSLVASSHIQLIITALCNHHFYLKHEFQCRPLKAMLELFLYFYMQNTATLQTNFRGFHRGNDKTLFRRSAKSKSKELIGKLSPKILLSLHLNYH